MTPPMVRAKWGKKHTFEDNFGFSSRLPLNTMGDHSLWKGAICSQTPQQAKGPVDVSEPDEKDSYDHQMSTLTDQMLHGNRASQRYS